MLSLEVRGGLNNQRECVINGVLAAAELNLTLVLPRLHPIGRGNEKYAPRAAVYEGRYVDVRAWAQWESLFNASAARALLGAAGIRSRLREPPAARVGRVPLPAVERVFPDCLGARKVGGTCVAQRAGESGVRLMRGLLAHWRGLVSQQQQRHGVALFEAGGSLCWNAYGSRNKRNCTADFPRACGAAYAVTNAWNDDILRVQAAVHAHIRTLLLGRSSTGATPAARHNQSAAWAAVHVRIFGCPPRRGGNASGAGGGMRASLKYIQQTVARLEAEQAQRFRALYLVSSIPKAQIAAYLPGYALTSKEDVLPRASQRLPFEVCAAIDYSIATSAPVYVGMRLSSFDVFAHAERREAGRRTVMRPGGKMC